MCKKSNVVLFVSKAPVQVNPVDEEEDEEEVMFGEESMEAEPQIELKGAEEEVRVEEANTSPGPSRLAGTTQPPDEEQAGVKWLFSNDWCR